MAERTLIWHANPVYASSSWCHSIAASKCNGGEVARIAPDYSPPVYLASLFGLGVARRSDSSCGAAEP